MMRVLLLLLTVISVGCASVRAPGPEPIVAYGVDFAQVQALPETPADRVTAYGPAASQRREVWLPVGDIAGRPLVVLVHGGCWLDAYGVDHARALAAALRDEGYAVLAPEYRRVGEDGGGWPQSRDDLLAALRRAPDSDLPEDFVLVGHSAGGHLALTVASALAETSERDHVLGVVGLAAITDPVRYAAGTGSCNTATPAFFGGMPQEVPARYAAADPLRAWAGAASAVPVVLLQGTADAIVPVTQAEALAAAPAVELRRLENAGHFDLIHPGTAAFGELLGAIAAVSSGARP